jgi:predicted nucleotidyltransferase
MTKARASKRSPSSERWLRGDQVTMAAIRKFARQVAERFQPDKIILFGSHAYGTPHPDSDVDILVIMPTRNRRRQAFKIHWAIEPPFPLDLLVCTPSAIRWRLAEGDSFLREIVTRGKLLYEKADEAVDQKGGGGLHSGKSSRARQSAPV